jgi:multidrug resistance efflux pump
VPLAVGKHSSQRDKAKAIGIVQAAEAEVLSAKASVRKAELDLSFTEMTAHDTEGVEERALRGGAVVFLRKPFNEVT